MKRIFFIFSILILTCLSIYAQGQSLNTPNRTADTVRTMEMDTNTYESLFSGKLEPAWVYIGEAKRAIHNGDIPYALYIMNKTLMYYPDNADAHYFLGLIFQVKTKKQNSLKTIPTMTYSHHSLVSNFL